MAEVHGATVTSTNTVVTGRARVKALHWRDAGAATGSIVLRDGGASGSVKLTLNTDANDGEHILPLGGEYIAFSTDVHATLTNVDSLTILYH